MAAGLETRLSARIRQTRGGKALPRPSQMPAPGAIRTSYSDESMRLSRQTPDNVSTLQEDFVDLDSEALDRGTALPRPSQMPAPGQLSVADPESSVRRTRRSSVDVNDSILSGAEESYVDLDAEPLRRP
eukprot:4612390-Prymnesium_polylepis.1